MVKRMYYFDWDENKNKINITKHGISFDEASTVFFDECAILFEFDSEIAEKYSLNGKKLYLYNEAKNKYEKIYFDSLDSISITKAGKYMFSDGKKRAKNNYLTMGFGGTSFIFVLLGIYVGVKKQYWFW